MAYPVKYIIRNLWLFTIVILLASCAATKHNNTGTMSGKQKVLKNIYPAFMWWSKLASKNNTKLAHEKVSAPVSFHSLQAVLNDGSVFNFSDLKDKKILLVNTASNCGYTNQYEELQKLYKENEDKLVVVGFPANDFKEQEKGTDEEIAGFCKLNYGVTFPLMKKSVVIKSPEQNEVYKWLTDPAKNGWNKKQPSWNFSKYLVDEEGALINYFGPAISPTGKEVLEAISK
jgi:glutathione peroxidase